MGSSRAQAEAFLQGHHMEWGFSERPPNSPDLIGRYYGSMPDPDSRSLLKASTLRVEIDVDQKSRVSDVRVQRLILSD